MAKETPLQAVKRLYKSKDTLIDKVVDVAREAGEDAAEVKERLATVSNKKLLRLAEISKVVSQQYGGSKEKLAEAVGKAVGKAKDSDYVTKLRTLSAARLLDMMRGASRRARRQQAAS